MNFFPRKIRHAMYPQLTETYDPKKNRYEIKKLDEEIRIISADIATRANQVNDNSILSVARLIPQKGRGYDRRLGFMESFKGINTTVQAKRIKQLFFDLNADYLVLDVQNAGISVFDSLTQITTDEERGIDYPAFTVVDTNFEIEEKLRDDLARRTLGSNPMPVVFPILATPQLNSQIAVAFRSSLQKRMWEFLDMDSNAEEFLLKDFKELLTDDGTLKAFLLSPFVQTGLLVSECLNLNMKLSNGYIKLEETPGSHKDRYTATSYLNYVVDKYFDPSIKGDNNDTQSDWDLLSSLIQVR
jgi:hypothetical protein